jgi:hypothetical protein
MIIAGENNQYARQQIGWHMSRRGECGRRKYRGSFELDESFTYWIQQYVNRHYVYSTPQPTKVLRTPKP